jgi:hypothetical protein
MNDERSPMVETEPSATTGTSVAATEIGEANRQKRRELDNALYAALLSRAHSDQARALVDIVIKMVADHELAGGTRTYKRDKKQTALRVAVEALLADLLQAQGAEKAQGYIYRTVRPEDFTGQRIGYRTFTSLVDAMRELGLLETHKGFQAWGETFGTPTPWLRKASRYRATKTLMDIFDQHGVQAVDFHKHFLVPLPENPLQLRAASSRNEYGLKITGKLMRFEPTSLTRKLEQQLKRLNEFLDGFELQGGIHRGYIRVFNNGDHPRFDWNMGGRLYSYGEFNYQQLDRDDRLRMTISGAPVCEIDIRASYLTIFHAWHGQQLDAVKDPYDLPRLGPEARDVVKMWITASFGNNGPISKWPRELVAEYHERTGTKLGKRYPVTKIGEKVMQAFPLLARLCESEEGHQRGWAELMYAESEAMLGTMLQLMNQGIPSLAVHDSIIVPIANCDRATLVLKHWYHRHTNAWPVLVSHLPKGYQGS